MQFIKSKKGRLLNQQLAGRRFDKKSGNIKTHKKILLGGKKWSLEQFRKFKNNFWLFFVDHPSTQARQEFLLKRKYKFKDLEKEYPDEVKVARDSIKRFIEIGGMSVTAEAKAYREKELTEDLHPLYKILREKGYSNEELVR